MSQYPALWRANYDIMPFEQDYDDTSNNAIARLDVEKRDANLLAVAITRARKVAWISSYGYPSILLEGLKA